MTTTHKTAGMSDSPEICPWCGQRIERLASAGREALSLIRKYERLLLNGVHSDDVDRITKLIKDSKP